MRTTLKWNAWPDFMIINISLGFVCQPSLRMKMSLASIITRSRNEFSQKMGIWPVNSTCEWFSIAVGPWGFFHVGVCCNYFVWKWKSYLPPTIMGFNQWGQEADKPRWNMDKTRLPSCGSYLTANHFWLGTRPPTTTCVKPWLRA